MRAVLNAPNLVTLSRIVLIPLIIGIYYVPADWLSFDTKNMAATAVFILAAASDWRSAPGSWRWPSRGSCRA